MARALLQVESTSWRRDLNSLGVFGLCRPRAARLTLGALLLAPGSWRLALGGCLLAAASWRPPLGGRLLVASPWRLALGAPLFILRLLLHLLLLPLCPSCALYVVLFIVFHSYDFAQPYQTLPVA